jgi:hypothetical protein
LYSTQTGVRLTTGSLVIDDKVTFQNEATNDAEAMVLDASLHVQLLAGSYLEVEGILAFD